MSQLRTTAERIGERVKTDPGFVAQLVANPRQVLESEGIPADAVNDVIGPAGRAPRGRADAEQPRCWLSIGCITTQCCLSISACRWSGSC